MPEKSSFDLTPDTRVLLALTQTRLEPLDALCELIDNSIDSFADAERAGSGIDYPLIVISIPGAAEVGRGAGSIRLRDNGPGLTPENAEKAITAGYSGKKRFGSLGLFGMGFNIATGKLGQRTKLITNRKDAARGLSVTIDLPKIVASRSYNVPVEYLDTSSELAQGTLIEIDQWWPAGTPNHGFARKLAGYPKDSIRDELGRRYATILRKNKIRITVNGEPCLPFEHCVWGEGRFVERQNGRIPARFNFNEVLAVQTRCVECDQLIIDSDAPCSNCEGTSFRTIEERVKGWVGIQRFDDKERYGIDLIRNGRAIRVSEQAAFFEYTDEFKKTIKDYPIDGQFGRIVGEVELDHVPVDFLKQDFQRSEAEWRNAMSFLRGDSSLQPTQPGADLNQSPIFRLFQGYRRVRNFGTRDMYMGYWDGDKPARISRDVEKDYYSKFLARLPGYFDDAEWWKKVEEADHPPNAEIVECTNAACRAQNVKGAESCTVCGTVIVGKECIACKQLIPSSAATCELCGTSQVPEVITPWRCKVCNAVNPHDAESCLTCAKPNGTPNPASRDALVANADLDDSLSLKGYSLKLADGSQSTQLNVDAYKVRYPIQPAWNVPAVPAISFRSAEGLEVFLDPTHRLFRELELRPEYVVASEAAGFIFDMNQRLISGYPGQHSVVSLTALILEQRFGAVLEDTADRVKTGAQTLFDGIKLLLSKLPDSKTANLYDDLSDSQKKQMVDNMLNERRDLADIKAITQSGEFLRYVDQFTIVDIFRRSPHLFFDENKIFRRSYQNIDVPESILVEAQASIRRTYQNCLEDLAQFIAQQSPIKLMTVRARASLELLQSDFE